MNYQFHEIANQYPLLEGKEIDELVESMRENGFDQGFPIVLFEGKILDGRNRYRAAKKAGVEPQYADLPTNTNPIQFVELANEHRRHLSPQFLAQQRAKRMARVAQYREEGKSLREIGLLENICRTQVTRDIEDAAKQKRDIIAKTQFCESPVPGGTSDSQNYASSKIDSERDEKSRLHAGLADDELDPSDPYYSNGNNAKGNNHTGPTQEELRDCDGTLVPERLRSIWESLPAIEAAERALAKASTAITQAEATEVLAYLRSQAKATNTSFRDYGTFLGTAAAFYKAAKPHKVCSCGIDHECKRCGGKGWLTQSETDN